MSPKSHINQNVELFLNVTQQFVEKNVSVNNGKENKIYGFCGVYL